MSLLTTVQSVYKRLSFTQPTSVIGNNDLLAVQMLAFTQDIGDELIERWDWQRLKGAAAPVQFTGNGTTATFNLPADFKSLSPSDTFVSSVYPTLTLPGPVGESDLLRMKATPFALQPSAWRRLGNAIEFYPVLQAGEIVTYVYAGNYWITDSLGVTPKATFTADSDLMRLSERLIMLGVLWKFKRAKGLDYAQENEDFERSFNRLAAAENQNDMVEMSVSDYTTDSQTLPSSISYVAP